MPQSKHRRGGKSRPREFETHAPEKKPAPSPAWVPATGVTLLLIGVAVILIGYLPAVQSVLATWPLLGTNWGLVGGFVFLMAGFGFLTRWR